MLSLFPDIFGCDNKIINIDMNASINDEDLAIILMCFLKRAVMDASAGGRSGKTRIDNFLSEDERRHARDYLVKGYVKRYGYYYYDDTNIKYTPKKNHENMGEKFQPTDHPHYSPIPLSKILDFFDIDHQSFASLIKLWQDDNWSRDNEWYIKFVEETHVM